MSEKNSDETKEEIEYIENEFIEMDDGVRLAAKIWLPKDARKNPVPAILEYTPYRKRDVKRFRDNENHQYFAENGYVGIRVDIRGSGDSEGVLKDEYLQQELDDGVRIIEWIAKQSWCDGSVGMIGISWGGFNGLQIAAMDPEPLKAIVTVSSTDDRYADDVHYMGGCLLNDNLSWSSVMFAKNSMPPDPEIVGDRWKDMWYERLEGSGQWLIEWLKHQHRDGYWKHGSICEDYSEIRCPVMTVSGWADGYTNAVFRMLESLNCPRKALIGPWGHTYPHKAIPGPSIDFLKEVVDWFDYHMKDIDNDVSDEPMLKAFMQDSMRPLTSYKTKEGWWIAEDDWPSNNIENKWYVLCSNRILDLKPEGKAEGISVDSPYSTGVYGGKWCSYSKPPDLPGDQRQDDAGSIVFTTPPLDQDMEILGQPVAEFLIESSQPAGMLAVRLTDIHPDSKASMVTYGILNLTHRDNHEEPVALEPGKRYKVKIDLNYIAQRFPKGHRIRLSVSNSYWPLAWVSPEDADIKIYTDSSRIMLPVRKKDKRIGSPAEPDYQNSISKSRLSQGEEKWEVKHDMIKNRSTVNVFNDEGLVKLNDIGTVMRNRSREMYSIVLDDIHSASGDIKWETYLRRGEWDIKTITHTKLTCDSGYFYVHATLDAYEGGKRIFSKIWEERIERKLV